jgi:uncharacterized membrane protein YgdD (TMEM256/DUF423 family)
MKTTRNLVLAAAGLFGFVGVALGAFGAHSLRDHLTDAALGWWQTAVEYHLLHAAALLALAFAPGKHTVAVWSFSVGIVLFSGSLYVMALTDLRALGMVTPVGGVAFLVGWGCLVISGLVKPRSND